MKKWLIVIAALAVAAVWQGSLLYQDVFAGREQAEQQAAQRAKEKYGLNNVNEVSFYHGNEAYFVVKGTAANDEILYVWVPKKDGKFFKRNAEHSWSKAKVEKQIRQTKNVKKLIDIRPGISDLPVEVTQEVPVWEIFYINTDGRYVFQYLKFEDGTDLGSYSLQRKTS